MQTLNKEKDELKTQNDLLILEINKINKSTHEKLDVILNQFDILARKVISLENSIQKQEPSKTTKKDTDLTNKMAQDKRSNLITIEPKAPAQTQTTNILKEQFPLYNPFGNTTKSFAEALKSSTSSIQNNNKSLRVSTALTKLVKINSTAPRSTYANQRRISVNTNDRDKSNFLVPYYLGGIKPNKLKDIKESLKDLGFFGVKIKNISFIANSVCEILVDMDYAVRCERLLIRYNKILQWLPTFDPSKPLKGSKVTAEQLNSTLADRLAKIMTRLQDNTSSTNDSELQPWKTGNQETIDFYHNWAAQKNILDLVKVKMNKIQTNLDPNPSDHNLNSTENMNENTMDLSH